MIVVVALASCGRAGFGSLTTDGGADNGDALDDAGDSGGDANTTDPLVEGGTTSIATGSTSVDVAIGTVTTEQTALFFSIAVDSPQAADALVLGELTDATHVHFERAGTAGTIRIAYQVVAWSGWNVVRGRVTMPASSTSMSFTVPDYDATHAFVTSSFTVAAGAIGADDAIRVNRATDGYLTVFSSTANTAAIPIAYQVVVIPSVTANNSGLILSPGEPSQDLTIVGPDPAFCILKHDSMTATNSASLSISATLTGDHFTISRNQSVGTVNVAADVVSSTQFRVQGGVASFAPGNDTTTVAITPLSSPAFLIPEGGTTDYTTDANPGPSSATLELFPDHVAVHRGSTAGNSVISWQIVELAP